MKNQGSVVTGARCMIVIGAAIMYIITRPENSAAPQVAYAGEAAQTSAEAKSPRTENPKPKTADEKTQTSGLNLSGVWRVYSERMFYDGGGGGALGTKNFNQLQIGADGKWKYGTSEGNWSVADITDEDWTRWGSKPYGPKQKIVLDGKRSRRPDRNRGRQG